MRPLRLELEGFTSYREPTAVDFADTDLLVFRGTTGSGKSSLIDAMIFALYGSVPRYDNIKLINPVISQGKVRARVRLDFEARGKTYTAVRVVQRRGAGATTKEARLEEWENGGPAKTLAATESELSACVQNDVIGLGLDHFTKCVVLPQGEFAAFLRAKPGERKQLLERLLGLGLYERLRKAASLRWRFEDGCVRNLQWQLESVLAHATPEALCAAEVRVTTADRLREYIDEVSAALARLTSAAQAAGDRWTKAADRLEWLVEVRVPDGTAALVTRHGETEEKLQVASEAWEQAIERLRGAQAGLAGLPPKAAIENVVKTREKLARLQAEIDQTRDELNVAAEAAASAARHEKSVDEGLAQARQSLGKLPARAELDNVRRDREQLAALERDVHGARERVSAARLGLSAATDRARSIGEDLARTQAVLVVLPTREGLENIRAQRARLARVESEAAATRGELAGAEKAYAEAARGKAAADRRLAGVTGTLEALRVAHSAADMARHLEEGGPCPVCLQNVVVLPEHEAPADLEAATEAQAAATNACASAQGKLERCASVRTARGATLTQQDRSAESLRGSLGDAPSPEEIDALLGRIVETKAREGELTAQAAEADEDRARCRVRHDSAAEGLKQQEKFAKALREDLKDKPTMQQAGVLLSRVRDAEERVQLLEMRARDAARKRAGCEARLNSASATLRQQKKFVVNLRTELAEAPTAEETADLLDRIRAADDAVRKAQAQENAAGRARSRAEQELKGWQSRIAAAWTQYQAVRDVVAEMKPPAAVEGDLSTSWTRLSEWAERQYAASVEIMTKADSDREKAVLEKTRLDAVLAERCEHDGLPLGPGEDPGKKCLEALGAARSELDHLREAAAERQRVAGEEKEVRQRALIAKDLGNHLGAKKFGAWMQNQILTWLVQGATARLRELSSGQYSLDLSGKNEFLVIDHRNADEPRLAKTLSGGETFLASLALALSLAEQVANLAAHGSAKLEALFLDEGFGTLDSETLDVVATTIEQLGTERMVGIVTHVPELADRIPVQYRVKKVGNSSSVKRVEV